MKYAVIISAVLSFSLLFLGIYCDFTDNMLRDKFYGFGTLMTFLVTFPLFLIWRRNKTNMKKYVWRNENLKNKKTDE